MKIQIAAKITPLKSELQKAKAKVASIKGDNGKKFDLTKHYKNGRLWSNVLARLDVLLPLVSSFEDKDDLLVPWSHIDAIKSSLQNVTEKLAVIFF